MFKFLSIAAVIVLVTAASASAANAAGCGCPCYDTGMYSAPVATARVPAGTQARRSFSYEPSMRAYRWDTYRGYRGGAMGGGRWYRDAGAKARGE